MSSQAPGKFSRVERIFAILLSRPEKASDLDGLVPCGHERVSDWGRADFRFWICGGAESAKGAEKAETGVAISDSRFRILDWGIVATG